MTSQPPAAPDPPTPVERLLPRERPVPDFGRVGYGRLDLSVFDDDNDSYWCDITGTPHRITDMSPDYRRNVLAFLESNARYFHLMTVRRRLLELSSDLPHGCADPPDLQRLRALLRLDPVTWITSTPVAQALKHAPQPAPRLSDPWPGPGLGARMTAPWTPGA